MIDSARIALRQVRAEDEDFLVRYLADEEHAKYLPLERAYKHDEALTWCADRLSHWRQHDFGTFIIHLRHQNLVIGYCGIEYVRDTHYVDIRYGVAKDFWSNGYAFEAAIAVLKYGFSKQGFDKLYGAAVQENLASMKLLVKLGMKKDKEFQVYGHGITHMSVNKEEYIKRKLLAAP